MRGIATRLEPMHANPAFAEEVLAVVRALVPEYARVSGVRDVAIERFRDGLSNHLYQLSPRAGTPPPQGVAEGAPVVLVRVYANESMQLIDRVRENALFGHIHASALGPPFYGAFANGIVYGFVPGRRTTLDELRAPPVRPAVAALLARWHAAVRIAPKEPGRSDFLEGVRGWATRAERLLRAPDFLARVRPRGGAGAWRRLLAGPPPAALLDKCYADFAAVGAPMCFCHNDLQAMNIIYDEPAGAVHFIDFEYSGINFRGFDLANHLSEYMGVANDFARLPSPDERRAFLVEYRAALPHAPAPPPPLDQLEAEVAVGLRATALSWALWGLVQSATSDIDFDYLGYAGERLRQYYGDL